MAVVIGDGAHSRDLQADLNRDGRSRIHVIKHHSEFRGRRDIWPYIAVNDPRLRARISEELDMYDMQWIHRQAWLGPDCTVDGGTHINYGVHMVRTSVGRHCTISPGVTICGDVTIGDRTLIGAGATICDRVTIGSDVTIGAGAVVLPETQVPDGETWVGVPARRV